MIVAACRKLTKAAVPSESQRMEVMSVVAESSPSDPAYVWLSQVLWNAAQLRIGEHASSVRLASALWDGYTNVEGSDIGRGKLLYLLYRLRRGEALRALASRTRDMENLITGCITAFERAEADVELLPGAYQLAAAYRQQAGSKANTRPWSWLFVKLTSLRHGAEGSGLHCDVDNDIVEVDPAGEPLATVNLRLAPASVHDPVVRLAIEFDETNLTYNLMEDGQYLLRERLVSVTIPLPQGVAEGDVLKLPYRLLGQTLGGSVLDMRDSLTVHISQRMYTKLAEETILSEWPGATGNPVTDKSFHGRQHEIKLIDSYIRVNTRPQSVMLFGQRRIGKTSLLQEIVRHLPPVAGNICGAFVDVSGLNLPPGASVGKALFDHIIGALDAAPSNAPLRRTLQDYGMKEFARLAKGLHPEQSLAHALERLREEIERATSGTIARIALCIDEFDRFVEPLLRGEREAIEGLMWNLRQIIQTSESISLVLAGSGLQRVFTSGYAQPLYGSIEEVHLKAFDWNVDQEAVQQTFLPAQVRAKICELKHLPDVSQRAYDLCGGHPYYLSLLGYAAAAFSKGRPLTPHMISRAAELMLHGELFASQRHIDAKRFYDHVFETLRALPQRELGLARILLAHIAERTTPEFPWLTLGEAIEVPELLAISSEQERQQALRRLESEQVLEEDTSHRTPRFRIRVPLTADAVRLDSVLLREQGTSEVKAALRQ